MKDEVSFILNGQSHGSVAKRLLAARFDANVLRPYFGKDGRTYVTANENGKPVARPVVNATATLLKDEWVQLDGAVQRIARERLRVFADLRASGLSYSFNGFGKSVLESQRMGDMTDAVTSMSPLVDSENDRPEFDLVGLPLPIIHKQFQIDARQLEVSRNGKAPLDTTGVELATRKVAERVEKMALGNVSSYAYGGYTLYGFRNFPQRLTQAITAPTAVGWTPNTLKTEILAMRQASMDHFYYGPWRVYFAPAWSEYLDDDFSAAKGDITLRERLLKIDGISSIATADHLPAHDILMIQQTSDVARAVVGMDFTTVEWDEKGGLGLNFMVMAILIVQLRADFNGNTGLVHGAV